MPEKTPGGMFYYPERPINQVREDLRFHWREVEDVISLGPFVNVKSPAYGAVGDGVNDDTAEIQAAIDAVSALGGGVVFFPAGYYLCSAELTIPSSVHLMGQGWSTLVGDVFGHANWLAANAIKGTVLKFTNTSGNALHINATNHRGSQISNLAILGPGSGTSVGLNYNASASATLQNRTHNIFIANFSKGVRFNNTFDNTHYDLHVWGCTDALFYESAGATTDQLFVRPDLQVNTTAINGQGGAQQHFIGGLIQSNTNGLKIVPGAAGGITGWHIDGAWFESNTTALEMNAATGPIQNVTLSRNRFAANPDAWVFGTSGTLTGIHFFNNHAAGVNVTLPSNMSAVVMVNDRVEVFTDNSQGASLISVRTSTGTITKLLGSPVLQTTTLNGVSTIGNGGYLRGTGSEVVHVLESLIIDDGSDPEREGVGGKALHIYGNSPTVVAKNTSASANEKVWTALEVDATHLFGRVLNDALSSAQKWIEVTRSGATVTKVEFPNGKVIATAGLGVGNSASATTPGSVVKKMEVFDAAGNSLGFLPIYDAIT